MWTSNIISVEADDVSGIAKITFRYVHFDGRVKDIVERISEPDSVKKIASDGLRELNRIDAIADLISNPPLGEIDFSIPSLNQEQIEEKKYIEKRNKLIQLKQDLDLKLIDEETYNEALSQSVSINP